VGDVGECGGGGAADAGVNHGDKKQGDKKRKAENVKPGGAHIRCSPWGIVPERAVNASQRILRTPSDD
jgi:hypothetical protein